jgi:hypothetical protein
MENSLYGMIMLNASDSSVILPGTHVRRGTEEDKDHYEYGVRISENYKVWPVRKWTQKNQENWKLRVRNP